ncbi:MAG: hypothetical protein K2N70_01705 [Helicobacter sp.]|nr:hypothetical protein [Helicobacter sp.]
MFNNNIGTIYVERVDATNSSGTLTYTTGISGTQGVETTNPDGTINPNDTQNIVVNTSSATLNINGAGGVDKFNIEASSFTKTLTIAGNLGTVPNYEEAKNNYDSVRIDLSKTSGVDLNISNLLVSNPNDEGIIITASKGADNITLVAGANHDVVEFKAGGGAAGAPEEYTLDLGTLRLAQGQSFTIDGLTITNITGFANAGSHVVATATILTATDIASLLEAHLKGETTATGANVSGTGITKFLKFEGKLESLSTKNGWLDASGNAKVTANDTTLVFSSQNKVNLTDIDLTANISGNDRTNGFGAEANKAQAFVAGANAVPAVVSGTGDYTPITTFATDGDTSASLTLTINGDEYKVAIAYTGSATATNAATLGGDDLEKLIKGATVTDFKATITGAGSSITIPSNISITATSGGKFTISGLESGDSVTIGINSDSIAAEYVDATPAVQGQLTIDFGADGLLAGQSYSFLGKTVLATKDLSGEEVAEAFAFGDETSSGIDGAVVLGAWGKNYTAGGTFTAHNNSKSAGIDPSKLLFDISGSSLILMEQQPGDISGGGLLKIAALESGGYTTLTGTGTLAVRTDKVTGSTTQQGEKSGAIAADSYVTFSGIDTGSAASGADAGTVSAIKANTSMLDTITNFDISNDKLLLKDVNGNALTFASGGSITSPTGIYVDTAGSTLTATGTGIISFGVSAASGAATGADAITLDQKLYAVVQNIDSGAAVGFEHGGDTYVVVGGGASGAATDDLVIKLAGVTGVTDITSILA